MPAICIGIGVGFMASEVINDGGNPPEEGSNVFTQPTGSPLVLADDEEVTFTHPTVTDEKIAYAASKEVPQAGIINSDLDFDLADEGDFIYDDTKLEFAGGVVRFKDQGGGTIGAMVVASESRVDANNATATIDGTAGGCSTNRGEYDPSWNIEKIFSGSRTGGAYTFFLGQNALGAGTVTIDLGALKYVDHIEFGTGYTDYGRLSNGTNVEVSTNGSSWSSIGSFTTQATDVRGTSSDVSVLDTIRYIRISLSSTDGGFYSTIAMQKVVIYKQNPNYPTGTYEPITTSDDNQISLDGFTEINSVTNSVTTPASTAIRMLVSFDGRVTWKKWDGSAWSTHAGGVADIENGNTPGEVATGFTDLNITTEQTLDLAWGLKTDSATGTPSVSAISLNYDAEGAYAPVSIGAYGSSADIAVQRLSPTQTKFKNQIGSTAKLFFNAITPG